MIDVLFFAELQEKVGEGKVTIKADGITLADLKTKLLAAYQLENLDNVMIAINEEYAQDETVIKTGDVVALIPPVSGG
ncbi:molybdopterin converting factor subunit 1 [Virgibacillus sp. DJP39]|uniref:molybdopterin converting factor subunit 1 n=1 Tax=Virgibacillus sp. DJP39 TaxID=3409790 RepID=UPI003BB790A6